MLKTGFIAVFVFVSGFVANVDAISTDIPQTEHDGGIKVVGKSLNPPKTHIANHGRIWFTITEVDKNKAIDDIGNTWTFDKIWKKDYVPREKSTKITKHGIDRHHALFESYRVSQQLIAKEKLDKVCEKCLDEPFGEIKEIFSYDFPERISKLDSPKNQHTMQIEALRASKYLQSQLFTEWQLKE